MGKIIDTIIGNLDEKREYKQNEARAKALPADYAAAYVEIKKYIFQTSGIGFNGTTCCACGRIRRSEC